MKIQEIIDELKKAKANEWESIPIVIVDYPPARSNHQYTHEQQKNSHTPNLMDLVGHITIVNHKGEHLIKNCNNSKNKNTNE